MISIESEATKRCPYPATSELRQMARLAWRNSHRCIGRLLWNSLELLDARDAATSRDVFEACIQHLEQATNGGRIRSTITVFQEAETAEEGIRIWNQQLIRYAGYEAVDGSILGDPRQLAFTRRVMAMGWVPPTRRGAFDVLPLVIQVPGESPCIYQIPPESILEVPLSHPDFPWFAGLNLRWHALPVISDMALVGEGRRFTAAPFNGHYMGTEIASRNLGDEQRYNLLPVVAANMGIDVRSTRSLWKDRALVELNAAVLHSFHEAGVTMVDHHSASAQFMQHTRNEESCGREVPGDWSWLVPPMSGSACPVFHRSYSDSRPEPAFIEQQALWH
jgi:nitric-oxide synthase, bacterial